MSFGTKQREIREAAGITQEDFAKQLHLSRSAVGMAEREQRKMPIQVLGKAVEVMDDGLYAMAAAQEVIGYSWIPILDGPNVDLHRASVAARTNKEVREFLEAMEDICVANPPHSISEHDSAKLDEALDEAADAVVALLHYIAIICREYKKSWRRVWIRIYQKFKAKGYIK
ncbi:helix-turn-helix domain-containing protein (plasmid) [Aneurinibacillus thermoaerophilus]|jgi:transcriptional regulator with XRE-family HTH domain|uniref:Helix-turn-helix domain-containing protein n=1 Tax=Aneurinibacillus thermoaerophilus TaxID=143495 RepID=A0ABX8YGI2_ANETH|nr:helix-turn-helix domain-containing protein [Aneurinibacillus thermoaerophilus]QYY44727.1 helix-turn-helix domain-containing protein [Aneurinibacillus thermoaerophilus]